MISEYALTQKYKCSKTKMERLRLLGRIKPKKVTKGESGMCRYSYDEEEIVELLGLELRVDN